MLTKHNTVVFVVVLLLSFLGQSYAYTNIVTAPSNSFWNTGMRLCDVNAQGNCDNTAYAQAIAKYGAGGIVCAALSFLAFVVFLPVRCLCNGFGGRKPSKGICPSTSEFREYTRTEILAAKLALLIVVVPIIIGVGVGIGANNEISSSINNITVSLQNSGDNIVLSLQEVRNILVALPITSGSLDVINTSVKFAQNIDSTMHNVHSSVSQYDNIRETVMIVGFAFSLALVVAGIVCAIFNFRLISMILAMVGLLVLCVVWISFGIHLVADKFIYDVCVDVNLLSTNTTSNSTSILNSGALQNLWSCGTNSDFKDLQLLLTQAMGVAVNDTCEARAAFCGVDPHWICASSPACAADTLEVVIDAQHTTIEDGSTNRTLRQCAVSCSNVDYKNVSLLMVEAVDQYSNFSVIYTNDIRPLIDCQVASETIAGFKMFMCDELFNAVYGVAVSNLIVGIFYVAFVVIMVVGFKRFDSLPE